MAKTGRRCTEEQIIANLKEAERAPTIGEVIPRHGIAAHRWKSKYSGMHVSDARG